ncbi:MAG: hypothetical protein Q8N00_17355 [Nitrospirota bacterium]|nr:hypothetical protein [Nitrospirota bacterium]MDP3597609.1 hypothetical protein [Nitrospirota bacterium]
MTHDRPRMSFLGSAGLLLALLASQTPGTFAAGADSSIPSGQSEAIQAVRPQVRSLATDNEGEAESRAVPGMRTPLQSLPLQPLAQARPAPSLPQTWDALWDITWQRAAFYYRIQAAPTTLQDPTCQGNLGLEVLVKNTIQAVALTKYGDAARFLSQFQDRSQCLTREGARGVEFALAMYVHRAVTLLPAPQAQIAVQGVLNLGMQSFDQLQYTGQSWWLPMVNIDHQKIQSLMATYPRRDLGLWLYDFERGMMVQSGFQDGMDRLLWSMQRLDNYGRGACNLLNMSATGFVCPDPGTPGGGGSSKGGAGMMTPPGGIPTSGVSCVLDSVKSSGIRGQFACMSKAIAGMTVDPRTAPGDLAKQASQQPGIRDKFCALSAEGDTTTTPTTETTTKEPGAWDKIKDAAGKVKDVVVSVVVAVFDKTPPVVDTLAQGASPEGADAARGTLQILQERSAQGNLADTGDVEAYYKAREGRVTTDPQANKRTINDDGTAGGCGAGSNAAARAKSLYQCTMGSDMNPRQPGAGMGGVRNPGSPSPTPNPTIALIDPSQATGPIPGAMSCMMQAGDLARNSAVDQKCAAMRCMQGEVCPCNRTTGIGGGQPMELRTQPKAGPDCMDGPCTTLPGTSGGVITGPKTGGGTGPLPAVKGPTPPPSPGGGPSTGPRPIR